jgi:hypothetical protein
MNSKYTDTCKAHLIKICELVIQVHSAVERLVYGDVDSTLAALQQVRVRRVAYASY